MKHEKQRNARLTSIRKKVRCKFLSALRVATAVAALGIFARQVLLWPVDLYERVVSNLLGNAVKYCRPGGEIRLDLVDQGVAALTVSDDGPGVPSDHVAHLFVRFFRGDPARGRSDGTGLGLAIARAGAEAHGGRLEFVGNSPGATFRLLLPRTRTDAPTDAPSAG